MSRERDAVPTESTGGETESFCKLTCVAQPRWRKSGVQTLPSRQGEVLLRFGNGLEITQAFKPQNSRK